MNVDLDPFFVSRFPLSGDKVFLNNGNDKYLHKLQKLDR